MAKIDKTIKKFCTNCNTLLTIKSNRDIIKKRFCSRSCNCSYNVKQLRKNPEYCKMIVLVCNTPDANKKKGHPGEKHPMWIKDRSKLKSGRCHVEELNFIKQVLQERNYTCELTGQPSNRLSVHHKNSYKDFPNQRFDRNNVVLIKRDIHRLFHKLYGTKNITQEKWNKFVKNKEYAILQ